jgi:hypothetical protein
LKSGTAASDRVLDRHLALRAERESRQERRPVEIGE